MKDGRKLLSEISALSPLPVYVRVHNLLVTGDGTPALKWGSTERLHRGRQRQAGLRLDHHRPHLRHLYGAGDEAAGADRLHAGSALDRTRSRIGHHCTPGGERQRSIRAGLIRPKDYEQVGGAGLPVGAAFRAKGTARRRWRSWLLGSLERAEHRVLEGHAGGVSQALRLLRGCREAGAARGADRAARIRPGPAAGTRRSSCASSWTTWFTARTM